MSRREGGREFRERECVSYLCVHACVCIKVQVFAFAGVCDSVAESTFAGNAWHR